ncbi:MAG: dTDP-4-dehydrorhamnose 3,5-epimerase [Candidatus Raymondbacteria bacterium RifOxyA12_full_50_37]|nr:MAG: dTDP-4-dehydrorhamnose 3,5-epimerase [Candidatus Raymondbacteria bacterium RifOxyA12_full_50_37]OGJ88521.1 MAG: dTDP-4-dehydrorhamnose 3,5-epimerase [Candidatus Raymondbacteria bacterium RIFOXYA2_FULL_49_16]OGJ98982.1 MAG: dTDP-4-dehydrorhamnose 3,5-epimerase [Candidatus Raymondbacteria bacterium RIFOXYC2_FULL_50_21]OGK00619.1 MAG: dTDP-4-dehydrorhamnose 3,5-epimerase [Candidatus Raymondbacteria bacterium RifOxyC12_full_50_8]OGP41492.1 MAG: dTDP-4-dehydrorhamnose 3,5-epimerase [Candidat
MVFEKTPLAGAWVIKPDLKTDERGYFARTFCEKEFAAHGLQTYFPQSNTSFNMLKGTLRGMHYQAAPHEEVKIVRCTRGAIYDVILDLRSGSATNGKWYAVELTENNGVSIYIPKGMAHGFITLVANTEVLYMMGEFFYPDCSRGVRWNEPLVNIKWPIRPEIISHADMVLPFLGGL